jgi:uncharacterized membrane protein required for colicin V production
MKTLSFTFLLAVYLCLPQLPFAQTDTIKSKSCFDTVEVSGYYVFVYTKSEVNKLIKNKNKKEKGKPFSISIGDEYKEFFIPLDSITVEKTLSSILNDLLLRNKTDNYIKFSSMDNYSFDDYNVGCLKSFKAVSEWPKFVSSDFYTITDRKSKYCFKIFSLSAKWLKLQLSKEATNEILARKAKYLNPLKPQYNIYIFRELLNNNLTPLLTGKPVKIWKALEPFW